MKAGDCRENAMRQCLRIWCLLVVAGVCFAATPVFAAHPLITDDTGTQGRGKFQLEVNGDFSRDSDNGAVIKVTGVGATLTYGIIDTLDAAVGLPYQHIRVRTDDGSLGESGLSDIVLYLKWRFYETEGFSLALKPGVTLPTGDEDKGLGTGRATYSLFFIATKELKPLTFHLNLGYIRNENAFDERKDLWHASLAGEIGVAKQLRLVANGGIEHNPDRTAGVDPAFILGGFIYAVSENLDIDAGIKFGLNRAEADYQLLAGITYRF